MDRRHFTRLFALAPVALVLKPADPDRFDLVCRVCGEHIGAVSWPMRVDREGETYCAEHAVVHPDHESGKSLIAGYQFGVAPGTWDAYRESCGIRL